MNKKFKKELEDFFKNYNKIVVGFKKLVSCDRPADFVLYVNKIASEILLTFILIFLIITIFISIFYNIKYFFIILILSPFIFYFVKYILSFYLIFIDWLASSIKYYKSNTKE